MEGRVIIRALLALDTPRSISLACLPTRVSYILLPVLIVLENTVICQERFPFLRCSGLVAGPRTKKFQSLRLVTLESRTNSSFLLYESLVAKGAPHSQPRVIGKAGVEALGPDEFLALPE